MVARERRVNSSELRLARRELEFHKKLIDEAVNSYLVCSRRLKKLIKAFHAVENEEITKSLFEKFISDDLVWNADLSKAVRTSSRRILEPQESVLDKIAAEISAITTVERSIRDDLKRIRRDLKTAHELVERKLAKVDEQLRAIDKRQSQLTSSLVSEKDQLAKRENFILRNTDKTKVLRVSIAKKQGQLDALHNEAFKLTTQRRVLVTSVEESKAAVVLGDDHPELIRLRGKKNELSQLKKHLLDTKSVAKRDLAKLTAQFGVSVLNERKREVDDALRALELVMQPISFCFVDIPKSTNIALKVKHFRNWFVEAMSLLQSSAEPIAGDAQQSKQSVLVRLLLEGRRQRIASEKLKIEKRRKQKERREQEAEKEKIARENRRAKLERLVAATERRRIAKLHQQIATARENLREFDSSNGRLDQKLESLIHRRSNIETRIERVLSQLAAKGRSRDQVKQMPAHFPAYDNALAALDEVDIARRRIDNLITQRTRLMRKVEHAEADLQASIQKANHSTSGSRKSVGKREINTWEDAELLAEEYMQVLGFADARRTGSGSDGGVDIESVRAVAQVKDQSSGVGRGVLQQIFGIAQSKGKQPYFFARHYSAQALEWGSKNRVKMFQFDLRGNIKEVSR